jgi:hypothetical protein
MIAAIKACGGPLAWKFGPVPSPWLLLQIHVLLDETLN